MSKAWARKGFTGTETDKKEGFVLVLKLGTSIPFS